MEWSATGQGFKVMAIHDIIMSAAGGTPITLSYVTSATASAASITIPATAQVGDIVILADRDSNNTTANTYPATIPTGFTQAISANAISLATYFYRVLISYKVLVSGDPGASITGMPNTYNWARKVLLVFRPSRAISNVTIGSVVSTMLDGNPAAQTITASSGALPLIVYTHFTSNINTNIVTPSFSPAQDGFAQILNGANPQSQSRYKIYNSSPANTTVDLGSNNGHGINGFYMSVS